MTTQEQNRISALKDYNNQINQMYEDFENKLSDIRSERELFLKKERTYFKSITPLKKDVFIIKCNDYKKNIYLEIKRYNEGRMIRGREISPEFTYKELFFKPYDISFKIKDFCHYSVDGIPSVECSVVNEKGQELSWYKTRVSVYDLQTPFKRCAKTYIYIMIDKNTGFYKIGRSNNPQHRERTLQSEKPTIDMIYNIKADSYHEKILHNKFKDKRIRGEWFDLSGSNVQYIKKYLKEVN